MPSEVSLFLMSERKGGGNLNCPFCVCIEYLEIPQRAKILNDRLRVISDLLSMLRDHLTNFGVEYQTLIIIYLIIIAVIVACVSLSRMKNERLADSIMFALV